MTDIYNWRGTEKDGSSKGPIYMLDDSGDKIVAPTSVTNRWLLEAELYVTDGAVFYCKGTDVGGDCNELRIQSTGPDDYYEVGWAGISFSFLEARMHARTQAFGFGFGYTSRNAAAYCLVVVLVEENRKASVPYTLRQRACTHARMHALVGFARIAAAYFCCTTREE